MEHLVVNTAVHNRHIHLLHLKPSFLFGRKDLLFFWKKEKQDKRKPVRA
jgi:hypothetical protein